jgi:hypothetical protein
MMGFGSVFSTKLDFTMRSASGVPERESVGECDDSSVSVGGSGLREGFSRRPKDAERTSMPITPPLGLSMSPARARWPKVIRSLVRSRLSTRIHDFELLSSNCSPLVSPLHRDVARLFTAFLEGDKCI